MRATRGGQRRDVLGAGRAPDEARRVALLHDAGILDSPPERSFDGLTNAAAALTNCPIALISLLDEERQWFKSTAGVQVTETPIAHSFCAHAVQGHGLFEVEDTHADSRFSSNPLVIGEPRIRFYAGQALELDGLRLGTLCVIDTRPRKLSDTARHALAGLGDAAVALIAARRSERELQAHRRRLADIALASGDWLWDADVSHELQWVAANTAADRAHGFLTKGATLPDGLLLDGRGEILQPPVSFHSLLARQTEIVRATIDVRGASGTRYLSFSALPRLNDDGERAGFRGTARNVSAAVVQEQERYEADVALRLEQDSAQRSAKLRSELVSRVSHELRTPLNAMLGFSQLLQRDSGDCSDPKFYALQINRAATHLLGLVNDMLDLARLESGRQTFDLRPAATANVVRRCAELMESDSRERGVEILWRIDPGAEAVRADLRALTQVLLNLLSNALKWSARGSKVTVTAGPTVTGQLTISVRHEGRGIAPELLPVLFQPFSQLSANIRRGGTGLGLSISQQLARAMGGDIFVTSVLERGSCFTVTLDPAAAEHLLPLETDFSALDAKLPVTPASRSLKVLYVEDDPVNALVLDRMLAYLGNVETIHADTAKKGREILALSKPDLIVLDMNLPDGHGLQVVEALLQDLGTDHVPIVALSADALPQSIDLARAAGFHDYLTKPIDLVTLERLLTSVRNRLGRQQ